MSTKYGGGISNQARWSLDGNPQFTGHAVEKWDERTPAGSVAPETAYEDAVDVSIIADNIKSGSYGTPDSAHYYYGECDGETYGAVFLVCDDVIKTVYAPSMVNHGPTRAYLAGYNHDFLDRHRDRGEDGE